MGDRKGCGWVNGFLDWQMDGRVDRWMDRCWEELMFDRWILYIKYHFMRRTTWYYCRWCVTCKWISCSVIFCQYKLRNVFFFYHTVSFLTLGIRNKLSFSKINTARSIISESAQCWVPLSFCLLIPFLICLLSWCWFWLRDAQCLWYIYKMTES